MLLAAAVVASVLALHGWSTRPSSALPGGLAGGGGGGHVRHQAPATAPLLSSQSFASYSYQVWPGTPSAAARSAMTGLSISVHRTGSGISLSAGPSGQPGVAHTYAGGARVYVVEGSMGDESGTSDYNLGDDGVVVTDAQGRVVQ
ncbi:hypothetical protein GCM10009798_16880 [Nocardioides panacihumi]|uniref:Uncharacterized protein n=1 Tax=Nocardioides panacihumi TaxID=400774 RepID=A0ABN2QTW5_9ACTN